MMKPKPLLADEDNTSQVMENSYYLKKKLNEVVVEWNDGEHLQCGKRRRYLRRVELRKLEGWFCSYNLPGLVIFGPGSLSSFMYKLVF